MCRDLEKIVRGVSLLELMIVLAIISLMAVMAFPYMGKFFSGRNLSQQTDAISSFLTRIRDLAMVQGHPWRIIFYPDQKSWISFCDKDDDCRMDPGEERIGPFTLEQEICFGSIAASGPNGTDIPEDGISFQDNCITFSRMGCCNAGTLYMMNKTRSSFAIRLYPASGLVRIWKYCEKWEIIK
jgi:prepilin-type N-terminal cleavage/methylation domain-containing protein